ncbi:MAG: AMP-binding protein, partial [Caulobacteraceae bacterium]
MKGPDHPALLEETIGGALDRAAAQWGDRLALVAVHQDVRWSWSELADRAHVLAAGLTDLGLAPGDRIGIWAPNCAEWVLTQLAAAKAGLILTTINPAYRTSEVEYALNKVGAKALVAAERFKSSDYAGMIEELAPEAKASPRGGLKSARLPSLQALVKIGGAERNGWIDFAALCRRGEAAGGKLDGRWSGLRPGDPINIQFTSGTTGPPKGATLSHRNILNNAYFVGLAQEIGPADRLCIPVPLYHCFGMVMGVLMCVAHGAAMVFPSATFEAEATLQTVERERCTALYGVPTMFIAMLGALELGRYDVSSLRTGIMAGSPCPVDVMREVIDQMGAEKITIAYGMTETSPVSFQTATDDALERRVSTVGRVQPHLEVKIVDAEGAVAPLGTAGELCTRGYSVMLGYWADRERTAEAVDSEGWMHTGDLATLDEEGYANIVGRIKDMVIRGGENLYPREIEEFLFSHPDVAEAQVVGVPDEVYGEELCAWIRLKADAKLDEAKIRSWCEGRI